MPRLVLDIGDFAWSRLAEQAAAEAVRVEDVVQHAVAYYLADLDRGRVAARPVRELRAEDHESEIAAPRD